MRGWLRFEINAPAIKGRTAQGRGARARMQKEVQTHKPLLDSNLEPC